MSEPLVYGHSEVARFAEPNDQELEQMLRDGKGRPSAVRFLVKEHLERKKSSSTYYIRADNSGYSP